MAGRDERQGEKARPGARRAEREARLAEQLRANLQRRKQQARGRAAAPSPDPGAAKRAPGPETSGEDS